MNNDDFGWLQQSALILIERHKGPTISTSSPSLPFSFPISALSISPSLSMWNPDKGHGGAVSYPVGYGARPQRTLIRDKNANPQKPTPKIILKILNFLVELSILVKAIYHPNYRNFVMVSTCRSSGTRRLWVKQRHTHWASLHHCDVITQWRHQAAEDADDDIYAGICQKHVWIALNAASILESIALFFYWYWTK